MNCTNCNQQFTHEERTDILIHRRKEQFEFDTICLDCYKAIKQALKIRREMVHPSHNLGYNPYQE